MNLHPVNIRWLVRIERRKLEYWVQMAPSLADPWRTVAVWTTWREAVAHRYALNRALRMRRP